MKKRITAVLFTLFASFFMFAFSPAVQKELTRYLNEDLTNLASAEDSIIEAYINVTGENYKDDVTLYNALKNNLIPEYKKFIASLEKTSKKFSTKEMQELNALYTKASKTQLEAFEMILKGIEQQNKAIIISADEKLSAAEDIMNTWNEKIIAIAKLNKVDLGGDEE